MDEPTYNQIHLWGTGHNGELSVGRYAPAQPLQLTRMHPETWQTAPVWKMVYIHEDTGIMTTNVEAFERFYYAVNAANKGE